MASGIEWLHRPGTTAETWNPWIGCTACSPGCEHCWAKREEDGRFRHLGRCGPRQIETIAGVVDNTDGVWNETLEPYFARGPVWQGDKVLERPLHWRKPRTVFVGSRTDIFHEDIPDEARDRVFAVMALCPQHTFLVLTKRAKRMREYLSRLAGLDGTCRSLSWQTNTTRFLADVIYKTLGFWPADFGWPLRNVWLGVSVCNPDELHKLDDLGECPAAVRYVSYEPALGPVRLNTMSKMGMLDYLTGWHGEYIGADDDGQAMFYGPGDAGYEGPASGPGLDWVIVGGESGPGARPMHPDWVRRVRDDCVAAGVPFFFKQWGEWAPAEVHPARRLARYSEDTECVIDVNGAVLPPSATMYDFRHRMSRVGKKRAGRVLDGRTWEEWPEGGKP